MEFRETKNLIRPQGRGVKLITTFAIGTPIIITLASTTGNSTNTIITAISTTMMITKELHNADCEALTAR